MEPGQVPEQLAFGFRCALFEIALGVFALVEFFCGMDLTAFTMGCTGNKGSSVLGNKEE